MTDEIDQIYEEYMILKLGISPERLSRDFTEFHRHLYLKEACGLARKLHQDYDRAIALAKDGLWMGFIAESFGFPVTSVRLQRKGLGASWQPLEEIREEDLKDKRLIVFDNDALTGKTVQRAAREIQKYSPKYMDLLFYHEKTPLLAHQYIRKRMPRGLPTIEECFNDTYGAQKRGDKFLSYEITKEGIKINYLREGYFEESYLWEPKKWLYMLNTRTNVPPSFRKVFTLEKDFEEDEDAFQEFLQRLGQK